jgi:DNA modification methylase
MSSLDAATRPLVITYLSPDDIRPDPLNPREHPARQISNLCRSISAHSYISPILLDEERVIIAGVARWTAAKKLGLPSVPTIAIEGLSYAQKHALRIADNKLGDESVWAPDKLRQAIIEIQTHGVDIDLSAATGFSVGAIDVIINPRSAEIDDDDLPMPPQAPRTKSGDIWVLGPHRIGCGDARDGDFVCRVVGPRVKVDAGFHDPPYNVAIKGHANVRAKHREFAMASGELSDDAFAAFLEDTLRVCAGVSRNGAVHFICMDWRHMEHLRKAAAVVFRALLNICVWNKSNAGMGSLYRSKHELISVYRVGDAPYFNAVELGRHGRNRTNVWDYPSVNTGGARRNELDWHPTVKPVAMVADAIKDVTRQGEIVFDAFLGSGTTLIAAERAGRVCRGVDIDPIYIDLAVERWETMTGQEAKLDTALVAAQGVPS